MVKLYKRQLVGKLNLPTMDRMKENLQKQHLVSLVNTMRNILLFYQNHHWIIPKQLLWFT